MDFTGKFKDGDENYPIYVDHTDKNWEFYYDENGNALWLDSNPQYESTSTPESSMTPSTAAYQDKGKGRAEYSASEQGVSESGYEGASGSYSRVISNETTLPSSYQQIAPAPGQMTGYGGGSGSSSFQYPSGSVSYQSGSAPASLIPCQYAIPVVGDTGYVSGYAQQKSCPNPARFSGHTCVAHVEKAQASFACQAKVYKKDENGQILFNDCEPIVEQVGVSGSEKTEDKLCGDLRISEKFFCENCRPMWYQCSFGLAFPKAGCNNYAQPDEPWQEWANCWTHHGKLNKEYNAAVSEGNIGWPEPREMLDLNPAPEGYPKKSMRSGRVRGDYRSGIGYEKKCRKDEPGQSKKEQKTQSTLAEAQARYSRLEEDQRAKREKKKAMEEQRMAMDRLQKFQDGMNSLEKRKQ
ncbi:hypothetical protein NHQ30_007135 [Ciborinia camelliae]|nr:hypothetical protein NHQ30_007135 [Ciborinia camelliae]